MYLYYYYYYYCYYYYYYCYYYSLHYLPDGDSAWLTWSMDLLSPWACPKGSSPSAPNHHGSKKPLTISHQL